MESFCRYIYIYVIQHNLTFTHLHPSLNFSFPTGGNFNPNPNPAAFVIFLSLFLRGESFSPMYVSSKLFEVKFRKRAVGFHFPRFDLFVEPNRDRAFGCHLVKIELRAFHLAPHRQEMSFQLLGG